MARSKMKGKRMLCLVLTAVLALFGLFGAALSATVETAGSRGVCYRVSGGRNEMFLLGSIHIGNERMYPLGSHIQSALIAADTLVFECDTESTDAVSEMLKLMRYPAQESLRDHISDETLALLERVARKLGYSMQALNALRPWAVVSALAVDSTAATLGLDDAQGAIALGVEGQIKAIGGNKPYEYLETADGQLRIMDGFSDALQEYLLWGTCEQIINPIAVQGADADISLWPQWWYAGDTERFAQSYLLGMKSEKQPELAEEYHHKLITERNASMALSLKRLLENDEEHHYFVTIGLLHLVLPEDSVVYELQKMGYTVEAVSP